mgnify:CR=1 FL=1
MSLWERLRHNLGLKLLSLLFHSRQPRFELDLRIEQLLELILLAFELFAVGLHQPLCAVQAALRSHSSRFIALQ